MKRIFMLGFFVSMFVITYIEDHPATAHDIWGAALFLLLAIFLFADKSHDHSNHVQ